MSGLRLKNRNRGKRRARSRQASARGGTTQRRKKAKPRRVARLLPTFEWNLRRFAIVASAVVLVAGMAVVISRAPGWGRGEDRFLLSRFDVKGNRVLTEEEVLKLSGVEMGGNLLDVRISALEVAVAASPRVDRAQARRVLPDCVVVTLDEKLPAALVTTGGGEILEVTFDGAVLPAVEQTALVDLPVITGAVGDVEPGIAELSPELVEALELLRHARDVSEGLWMEISEVRIAPESGLVVYAVADGAEIRVGSGALSSDDLERLWRVLCDIRDRGEEAESIDLRFQDQIVVRLS